MKYFNCKLGLLIFVLLGLSMFSGCFPYDPDCDCNCVHTYLSFEIPYKEGDTVRFTNSLGNKLVFTLKKSVKGEYIKTGFGNPDCGTFRYYNEYNNNFFEEESGRKRLFIGNYANGDTIYDLSTNVYIGIDSFNFAYWTEWLKINSHVIPSITLNGKNYKDVFLPDAATYPGKFVYYNKQLGIISFKTDSVQWYLDN